MANDVSIRDGFTLKSLSHHEPAPIMFTGKSPRFFLKMAYYRKCEI